MLRLKQSAACLSGRQVGTKHISSLTGLAYNYLSLGLCPHRPKQKVRWFVSSQTMNETKDTQH
jgi:hypothetical protein